MIIPFVRNYVVGGRCFKSCIEDVLCRFRLQASGALVHHWVPGWQCNAELARQLLEAFVRQMDRNSRRALLESAMLQNRRRM